MRTALVWLIVISAIASAQIAVSTGTIQGTVVDTTGAAVPGVRVSVTNVDTAGRRTTQTDGSGQFTIPGLSIGRWTVTAEAPGFASVSTQPVSLSVGQVLIQRIRLDPAGLTETMEVHESPDAIDVAAASASITMGGDRIEEAPARSRNYLNFVLAAPAVAPSAGTSSQRTMTGVRAPLADTGFTFGGMRPRNNSVQIDGVDNRDETTGGNRVSVGLEMVQEFRVSGVSTGAELGGAAGGLLNMVTRSGTNIWHGDATFFMQNETLNARRAEVDSASAKPRFRRYQPGASALGPIRRNRTFIGSAVEQELERSEEPSNIPPEVSGIAGIRRGLFDIRERGTTASVKLDHQPDTKDTISLRHAFSRGRLLHDVQASQNFADVSTQGSSLTTDNSLVGSWLRVASAHFVNDLRGQFGERTMTLTPNSDGPLFEIPGAVSFGQHPSMSADRTERHFEAIENLTVVAGSHRLTAGADLHAITLDSAIRNRYAGVFVFPNPGAYLAGRPDIFIQAFGNPQTSMRTFPLGAWLQDRWEPRPGLLLETGVRFDRQTMPDSIPGSGSHISPRLGVAWRPISSRSLVIRAGAGLFYDRFPLAFLNEALQKDGVRAFEQYLTGPDAVRALEYSGGSTLHQPLPDAPLMSWHVSQRFPSTYSRKLNVGLEYGLNRDTTLTIEATHVRGFHLPRMRGYTLEQTARSSYGGVTVFVNRRLSREVAYLISYSVGRARDDASDFDEQPSNPTDLRVDWGPSRQDQRHRLSVSGVFELPGLEAPGIPKWLREGLDRISVAPILSAGSGRPLNALLTTDVLHTGAFPLSARPPGFSRNPFLTAASVSLDLRVMKTIPVHEGRAVLQYGVECFNLLNHTNVERVSPWYSDGSTRLGTYGLLVESLPARQVQLMIQFEF